MLIVNELLILPADDSNKGVGAVLLYQIKKKICELTDAYKKHWLIIGSSLTTVKEI